MLVFCSLPATASGISGDDFALYVNLASDYVFRGSSQTGENPVLQLGFDFEHKSGLFAGIWGSNVDFPPRGPFEDERDVEVQLYAGYGIEIDAQWGLAGTVARYEYPGAEGVIDWNYTELGLALVYDEATLFVAYSGNALGSQDAGIAVELTDRWQLPSDLAMTAGVGFYDLDSPFLKDYFYWNVELSLPMARFTFTLGYFDTDQRGEDLWGERAEARLVAAVSYRIL